MLCNFDLELSFLPAKDGACETKEMCVGGLIGWLFCVRESVEILKTYAD